MKLAAQRTIGGLLILAMFAAAGTSGTVVTTPGKVIGSTPGTPADTATVTARTLAVDNCAATTVTNTGGTQGSGPYVCPTGKVSKSTPLVMATTGGSASAYTTACCEAATCAATTLTSTEGTPQEKGVYKCKAPQVAKTDTSGTCTTVANCNTDCCEAATVAVGTCAATTVTEVDGTAQASGPYICPGGKAQKSPVVAVASANKASDYNTACCPPTVAVGTCAATTVTNVDGTQAPGAYVCPPTTAVASTPTAVASTNKASDYNTACCDLTDADGTCAATKVKIVAPFTQVPAKYSCPAGQVDKSNDSGKCTDPASCNTNCCDALDATGTCAATTVKSDGNTQSSAKYVCPAKQMAKSTSGTCTAVANCNTDCCEAAVGMCSDNAVTTGDVVCTGTTPQNKGRLVKGTTIALCCEAATVVGMCSGNTVTSGDFVCSGTAPVNKGPAIKGTTSAECCEAKAANPFCSGSGAKSITCLAGYVNAGPTAECIKGTCTQAFCCVVPAVTAIPVTTTATEITSSDSSGSGPNSGSSNSGSDPETWTNPSSDSSYRSTMYVWQWVTLLICCVCCICCGVAGALGGLFSYQKNRKRKNPAWNQAGYETGGEQYAQGQYAQPQGYHTATNVYEPYNVQPGGYDQQQYVPSGGASFGNQGGNVGYGPSYY